MYDYDSDSDLDEDVSDDEGDDSSGDGNSVTDADTNEDAKDKDAKHGDVESKIADSNEAVPEDVSQVSRVLPALPASGQSPDRHGKAKATASVREIVIKDAAFLTYVSPICSSH